MGQQYYSIKRMPAPGSPAEREMLAKKARKAAEQGKTLTEEQQALIAPAAPKGQRVQPQRKNRQKKG
jgi:YidC/Oxa1 family membrane protein insertase